MSLATKYLGLDLAHPLIAGASPLSYDLDKLRELEDGGIAAITMYSLFEEQISQNLIGRGQAGGDYYASFAGAVSLYEAADLLEAGVESYLLQLGKIKEALQIPVIASLNGAREGDWVNYASLIQSAGADALELNLYFLPTDFDESSQDIEDRCVRVVEAVSRKLEIPLTVKLSSNFTALPHLARRLCDAGADGLVLFNRFYQPEIDTDEMEVCPSLNLSQSTELRERLRWLALFSGRVDAQLAVSGGVHTGLDLARALMAGADVVQVVSTLLQHGSKQVQQLLDELGDWMAEKEFESVDQFRGCLNYLRCPEPTAIERANYMRVLKSESR